MKLVIFLAFMLAIFNPSLSATGTLGLEGGAVAIVLILVSTFVAVGIGLGMCIYKNDLCSCSNTRDQKSDNLLDYSTNEAYSIEVRRNQAYGTAMSKQISASEHFYEECDSTVRREIYLTENTYEECNS